MAVLGTRRSILLPVSSVPAGGRSVCLGSCIVHILCGGGREVAVRLMTPDDNPVTIAGEVASGSLVAALGGDRYLGVVARGCHEFDAIFVPIPGDRGNDLHRALRIGTDPLAYTRSLAPLDFSSSEVGADSLDRLASRIRPLDGVWVRLHDDVCFALGTILTGLDARANILANESSFILDPLTYGYGAFAALVLHKPTEIVTTVDGVKRNMSGWVASASNSGVFGGGITLVESSDMGDGVLEVCHVGPLSLSRALPVLTRIAVGRAKVHLAIEAESTRAVSLAAPAGMIVMADGDRITSIPFTVDAAPGVVSVLV